MLYVRFGKLEDFDAIVDLDKKAFPSEWIVSRSFFDGMLFKNPSLYRVLEVNGKIIGFYCVFPLLRESFEKLLVGEIIEKELPLFVVDYNVPKEVCLYLATVNIDIDIEAEKRQRYKKVLLNDMSWYLSYISNKGIVIKEVGAIAITNSGHRFCSTIGLLTNSNIEKYAIFRGKVEHLTL